MLSTLDDFQELLTGCCYRNYLADPDEWTNLFKVAGDDGKGRWRAVFPTDGIADSRQEHYELTIDGGIGPRGVTIRATDSMNNVATRQVDAPR